MNGYGGGEGQVLTIGVCVRGGKNSETPFRDSSASDNLVPKHLDLWVSQVNCTWSGLNRMYANTSISFYSGHTRCGRLRHGMGKAMEKFYFDGHARYRKTKHATMIAVQNIVTSKHANYLGYPCQDSNLGSALGPFQVD